MFRIENDLLGDLQVPINAYYGVQTQRAIENFKLSNERLSNYPAFIKALAYVKWAAAKTNVELGVLDSKIGEAIIAASKEVITGKYNDQFPVDLIQGGAGTSTNMNINEVIANVALEKLGHKKGEYQYCSPNDHVNLAQSTNDAYPTSIKLALLYYNDDLIHNIKKLVQAFRKKSAEFSEILKMGRTHLQDAVPMTLGQEFEAFAVSIENEIARLQCNSSYFLTINMGATAIGTGLNAFPGYASLCAKNLAEITGRPFVKSANLIESTPDTSPYVFYSSSLKGLAIKISKLCNDLRLLASGPRCGLYEIKLPPMQPGSSIMPGKVNPVIPEVLNQLCFKVIGNDLSISLAAEAGQLQLNVMEPVIMYSMLESLQLLTHGLDTLAEKCIVGITCNGEHTRAMVLNSIGIVTALNPHIGYKNSTKIAKEAFETGGSVYDLIIEKNILTKDVLDKLLNPENMLGVSE